MRFRSTLLAFVITGVVACDTTPTGPDQVTTAIIAKKTSDIVYQSGTDVMTWDAIPENSAVSFPYQTYCTGTPKVGLTANWKNPHNAFVVSHPWQFDVFYAPWINAWSTRESVNSGSTGPGYWNWTKYRKSVTGNGTFVVKLMADNCSWVYLDGVLVGVQNDDRSASKVQYGLTLNGTHTLEFIVFDGGGASGGKFVLETTTTPPPPLNPDLDGDGHNNDVDAFPLDPKEWVDSDGDGVGDNSDALPNNPAEQKDTDLDGVGDKSDNCPLTANADQSNIDGDAMGDVCDPDMDGDGVNNEADAYPSDPTRSSFDVDGDGINDSADNCKSTANADQADLDNDGIGDACDTDIDGDGFVNADDAYPRDATRHLLDTDSDNIPDVNDNCPAVSNSNQADLDGDGVGDACDSDVDGDGYSNADDAYPRDPALHLPDSDNDGINDAFDNCRLTANAGQADLDHDGVGDACDGDIDGDGVSNASDAYPTNAAEWADSDGDGIGNNADPFDNSNTGPWLVVGTCNTGVANWSMGGGTWANDLIASAYAANPNHGKFVSAVETISAGWMKSGRITGAQHGAIVACAARMK